MEASIHAKAWDPGRPGSAPMKSLCGLESWVLIVGKEPELVTCNRCLQKIGEARKEKEKK